MSSFASFQHEIDSYNARTGIAKESALPGKLANASLNKASGNRIGKVDVGQQAETFDDGRTIMARLLQPTEASTASLASMLNTQIDHSQGEVLIWLSPHNLNERSFASIFEATDRIGGGAPPGLPSVSQEDIQIVLQSLKDAASEVSLHVSILWNPFDTQFRNEEAAISQYGREMSANDDETRLQWSADNSLFVLVRSKPHSVEELQETRVAVCGNVDAGKSTLLGVLTKGRLDDGRGRARVALFRHKHEIESGRTSSVGMEILGFGPDGNEVLGDAINSSHAAPKNAVDSSAPRRKDLSWDEICKEAAKVVGFVDLAGHAKYFKTTIGALSSCSPDFVLLIVGANAGIIGMSKEHLSVALALNVPVVCVVTKIDSTPANVLDSTLKQLSKILRSPGCRKHPVFVKNRGMACSLAHGFVAQKAAPIFLVSNVTGAGLESLKCFLNAMSPVSRGKFDPTGPLEMSISDVFSVPFVGCVVSGVLLSGSVKAGDPVLIGVRESRVFRGLSLTVQQPDSLGAFIPTSVRSIERKRVRVAGAEAGQSVALALKRIRRNQVRKGMVVLAHDATPKAVTRFTASCLVLYHNSTLSKGYQAMAHIGVVRQTVKIVDIDKPFIRTGDRATVTFEFIKSPEYCRPGSRILFREGKTKGLGVITAVGDDRPGRITQAPNAA